jgi:hypothetical protein
LPHFRSQLHMLTHIGKFLQQLLNRLFLLGNWFALLLAHGLSQLLDLFLVLRQERILRVFIYLRLILNCLSARRITQG